MKRLVSEENFDAILNELSIYITENEVNLAKESIVIIGELGTSHPDRINSVLTLFLNLIQIGKTVLYGNIVVSLKEIFSNTEIELTGK